MSYDPSRHDMGMIDRAFALADECMTELLLSECIYDPDQPVVLYLADYLTGHRCDDIELAAPSVRKSLFWLIARDLAEIKTSAAGICVVFPSAASIS